MTLEVVTLYGFNSNLVAYYAIRIEMTIFYFVTFLMFHDIIILVIISCAKRHIIQHFYDT